MFNRIYHLSGAVAMGGFLVFMVASCGSGGQEATNKTSLTATASNVANSAQSGITTPIDSEPKTSTSEPPPPPPPSATPFPMVISDTLAEKAIAMSLKSWHISGVKATVVNDVVTLTGNADKKDRRIIMDIANQHEPKKVIDKINFQ